MGRDFRKQEQLFVGGDGSKRGQRLFGEHRERGDRGVHGDEHRDGPMKSHCVLVASRLLETSANVRKGPVYVCFKLV